MRQPKLRCVEFVESVTEWMEGALGDEDRLAHEEHLAVCPHCIDYVDELRIARAALRANANAVERDAPPPAARAALLDAFRRQHGR